MALVKLPLLNKIKTPDLTDGDEGPGDRMKRALSVAGPPIWNIESTQNMRFMKICYSDSSFVMIDRTVKNPQQAIMGHAFGHHQEITGLQWMGPSSVS